MAFIVGTDTINLTKEIGGTGSNVIGSEVHYFVMPYGQIVQYNPYGTGSQFVRLRGVESFEASEDTNLIEVYDGRDLYETKSGRTTSTLTVTQNLKGTLVSIARYKGLDMWFVEAISDDRAPVDANNNPIYYEMRLYRGTLRNIREEKGNAETVYKITGEGKYEVAFKKVVVKGITPCGGVTLTPTGGTTATSGTAKTFTVTAKDLYQVDINLIDLTVDNLLGEITAINIVKVSGTPTISVANGTKDNEKLVTFTGTGTCVVKAQIVTKNSGIWESSTVTITVS